MANCIDLGGGVWISYPIKTCDIANGSYCNLNEGDCSDSIGICSEVAQTFTCTGEGIFPDPFDCQRYHMCVLYNQVYALESRTCAGLTAFSAVTSDCSASVLDSFCSGLQFTCEKVGDTGAWPGNSNIFYICIYADGQYHPQMHRCLPGYHFENGRCLDTTTTTITSTTITPTTDSSGGGDNTQFQCEKFGLFLHETNCRQYYYCDGTNVAVLYTCVDGTYFDIVTSSCIAGSC